MGIGEDREGEEREKEKGGGKERRKWRWRGRRGYNTIRCIGSCDSCRGGMQSWGRKGWTKQAGKLLGETEGRKCSCTGQRNEAIRFWDLALNSGTRSQICSVIDYGLQKSAVQHCTCQMCLWETERWCMLSLRECELMSADCWIWYVHVWHDSSVGIQAWRVHSPSPPFRTSSQRVVRKTACIVKPR